MDGTEESTRDVEGQQDHPCHVSTVRSSTCVVTKDKSEYLVHGRHANDRPKVYLRVTLVIARSESVVPESRNTGILQHVCGVRIPQIWALNTPQQPVP